ncbi:MAG: UDP-N-acetylmuramoyl-L-alanine--D-glutamate ligase [Bacteroidetes bacterium]|nr:MAG: UDP-N-acetylmuramoyl-L-alanine--D-glutamate ligase [Bacteroidota bacterium]
MVDLLRRRLEGKKILLLGFGREGESSYRVIRELFPRQKIWVADRNPGVTASNLIQRDDNLECICGEHYLDSLNTYDVILKSPGITLKDLKVPVEPAHITSQTDLFLEAYAPQVTGITGTKGKSTTASLIAHILTTAGEDTVLLGNIGTPAWHFIDRITPATRIVNELSSHQLEYIHRGPHIAVLLNIFEEHLDAYRSFREYQLAKMKIATTQQAGDFFLFNADDPLIQEHIHSVSGQSGQSRQSSRPSRLSRSSRPSPLPLSLTTPLETGGFRRGEDLVIRLPGQPELVLRDPHNRYLKGEHNQHNILIAATACRLQGVSEDAILDGIASFKGLAHRTEELGIYHNIRWVNDSIATIPEACIAALQAIHDVDTLILGGFDRGINYSPLARFLLRAPVRNLILTGAAGRRIGTEMESLDPTIKTRKKMFYINRFDELFPLALEYTRPGATCLLSPAAASYDEFRSFEERGFRFRELITGRM